MQKSRPVTLTAKPLVGSTVPVKLLAGLAVIDKIWAPKRDGVDMPDVEQVKASARVGSSRRAACMAGKKSLKVIVLVRSFSKLLLAYDCLVLSCALLGYR